MTAALFAEPEPTGVLMLPNGEKQAAGFAPSTVRPLVSCVMVSRGNENILRHSANCFLRQTYANRELVIVLHGGELTPYLATLARKPSIRIFMAPASLTLGDVRNMSIARAQGSLICQWDDDDLHHPRYLDTMVGFLETNRASAAFLDRLTFWWPARRQFAISTLRAWENSMVALRSVVPIYANLERGEDTRAMSMMLRQCATVLVSSPQLYVYAITGQNTSGECHMESLVFHLQSQLSAAGEYGEIFQQLDQLYGVSDYESYCVAPSRLKSG